MERFDVVVAGGGIAGSTTAAALARKGQRVLVCEAGLPSTRRLAGELMHPPGAANLEELGLLSALEAAGGVPVYGFALFQNALDRGTVLSYTEIPGSRPTGIALEHGLITRTLLDAVSCKPGVTVWNATRVLGADLDGDEPVVQLKRNGEETAVAARLVVSAEGHASKLRERAGIHSTQGSSFRMVGWKVPGGRLPYPGYGHVFIGGPTPILAYQVSQTEVRIMFELDLDQGLDIPEVLLAALPARFRADVEDAIANEQRATARFCGFRPGAYVGKNLAIVGDAGGCVHPLIASGMSFCIGDAVRLADAVGTRLITQSEVDQALSRYQRIRQGPMATRGALGPAMVEALCDDDPAMQLLRHGLFKYWEQSPRGRSTSMSLLSTQEHRMSVMAREYAIVCANALRGLKDGAVPRDQVVPALIGLAKRTLHLAKDALAA